MKHLSKSLLSAVALLVAAGQFSVVMAIALPPPLNDSGLELTINGGVKEDYNSNVLSAVGGPAKFDDYITTFTPGLSLEYGKNAITDVTFNYTETFTRYARHPSLNDELSNVAVAINRKQGDLTLQANAGFVQNATNTPSSVGLVTVPGLIRSDVLSAGGSAEYIMSEKFDFSAGLNFARTSYLYTIGKSFQNSDSYSVPTSVYYKYTDELSFGLGYTYSQTDQKNSSSPFTVGRERDSHTFSFNTLFAKWEKLSGTASVGVTINSIQGDTSVVPAQPSLTTTTGSYSLGLQYDYSDTVAFTLNGNRNFTVGVAGQNVENTGAGLGATFTYSDTISFQANVITINYSQYLQQTPSRDDLSKTTGITANWKPYDYLTLSAGYTYFMNSSTAAGATYNINDLSISATIHY